MTQPTAISLRNFHRENRNIIDRLAWSCSDGGQSCMLNDTTGIVLRPVVTIKKEIEWEWTAGREGKNESGQDPTHLDALVRAVKYLDSTGVDLNQLPQLGAEMDGKELVEPYEYDFSWYEPDEWEEDEMDQYRMGPEQRDAHMWELRHDHPPYTLMEHVESITNEIKGRKINVFICGNKNADGLMQIKHNEDPENVKILPGHIIVVSYGPTPSGRIHRIYVVVNSKGTSHGVSLKPYTGFRGRLIRYDDHFNGYHYGAICRRLGLNDRGGW